MLDSSFYLPFLSQVAKERRPSPIRGLLPLENKPGVISLLAGKPNPDTFPITGLTINVRSPLDDSEQSVSLTKEDIAEGMQYAATAGIPRLQKWLMELQKRYHGRDIQSDEWTLSVGSGSNDIITKAFTALLDPGDVILVETPTYAGVLPAFHTLKCEMIEVETDAQGISTSSLRKILESWPEDKKRPKFIYTVPYGCNPTGTTTTLERRKEALELAREHNLLIIEDDPYFFLYYGDHRRYPSYFSLEKEGPEDQVGRVIRFDSLSKVVSAGIRIGFVSGPKPVLEAINMDTAVTNLQPSSLSQIVTYKVLESWGYGLFQKHVERVANLYREKRDVFDKALREIMSTSSRQLISWSRPEAGMFFWFKIHMPPSMGDDSEGLIRNQAYEKGVLALPGTLFLPNGGKTPYVRASFSLNPENEVRDAVERLKQVIEELWRNEPRN